MSDRKTNFIVPMVPDTELLNVKGDRIFIPTNQSGQYIPPLVRIGGELRRLAYETEGGNQFNINRIAPPNNIQEEYFGLPGSTLSLSPDGGFHVTGIPVNYIFLDSDEVYIGNNNIDLIFPTEVGESADYYVYTTANGAGPAISFTLTASEEFINDSRFVVSDLRTDFPSEAYPGINGNTLIEFTVDAAPDSTPVTFNVSNTKNITINPNTAIANNDLLSYGVHAGSAGDIEITYYFATESGYRTPDQLMVIPNDIARVNGSPYGFIQSFPTSVASGDIFHWQYGNVLPGYEVFLINMVNLATPHVGGVNPGESVSFEVTGTEGEAIVLTYLIRYQGYPVGSETVSAFIGTPGINVDNLSLTLSPPEIELLQTFSVAISGVADATNIEILDMGPDVFVNQSNGLTNGDSFLITLSSVYDPSVGLSIPMLVTGLTGSSLKTITFEVNRTVGRESVLISRVFTKPAGVTSLTISSHGGEGIGNDTILSGLINYVYPGAVQEPPPESQTFDNLSPERDTIYFTLADGATAWILY